MPKQSTERKRRRNRQAGTTNEQMTEQSRNVQVSRPSETAAGPAPTANYSTTNSAATNRRVRTPVDAEQRRLADIYRLTRTPLLPARFQFMSAYQLLRAISLGVLLFSYIGTLLVTQGQLNLIKFLVHTCAILVFGAAFIYSTHEREHAYTLYNLLAITVEIFAVAAGISVLNVAAPLYFPFLPFYIIVAHIHSTFDTRPAIGLTFIAWLSFLLVLIAHNEINNNFLVLALMLSIPFFVVMLVVRFVIREGRQRVRLVEALERLKLSEERYRQVTDRANDAIFTTTATGRISFINPKTSELTGYPAEEMIGREFADFVTANSRHTVMKVLGDNPTGIVEPRVIKLHFTRKNNTIILGEVTVAPIQNQQGKLEGWVGIARDVTERARMQEQLERTNRDLKALNAINNAAGQSLDLERLLNDVVTTLVDVLKADVAGITLIEEQTRLLKVGAYKGLSDTIVRAVTNAATEENESLTREVVRTGKSLLIKDLTKDKRAEAVAGRAVHEMGLRSYAAAPVKSRETILGVVSIISHAANAFDDDDLNLLMSIGNSLAVAIENARLYGTSLNQVREMTCLAEIARAINLSESLGQTLTNIAQSISETLGYKACAISLVNRELAFIEAYGGHGLPPGFMDRLNEISLKHSVPREELLRLPIFRTMDVEGPVVYQNRGLPSSGPLEALAQEAANQGWTMTIGVPFHIQGRPIGVISCYSTENTPPPESELRLLMTIANQTSLAVQNAQLFREQQRRADQLRAVSEIGRQIGAILNLEDLLPFITKLLQQTFDYYMVAIFLADNDNPEEFSLRAAHGWNMRLVTIGRKFHIKKYKGKGLVAWVARHGEPLLVPDITHEPRYMEYDEANLVKSELVVPIKRGEQVIGVIDLASTLLNGFDEIDLATMLALAEQVSIALVNARLYTEVNRVVVQLTNTNVELAEATRHKSEFLANMSHELRTPLNAIIGFSEVLQDQIFGPVNDRQLRYVGNILTSGRHLLALVNDVLDLAKVEAGRMELHPENFTPDEAITDVQNIVSVSANKKQLIIHSQFRAGIKTIFADKSKFKQIMYNLLSNAVKFTPEKGKVVIGNHLHQEQGKDYIAIWVRDTGIGIRKDDQTKIFEEFKQVDTSYARQHQGTGLGLALSKRLVELHGGRIWVESVAGVGSLFTFLLPIKTEVVAGATTSPAPLEAIDRLLEADAKSRLDKHVTEQTERGWNETPALVNGDTEPVSGDLRVYGSLSEITPMLPQTANPDQPVVLVVDDDDRAVEILELYLNEAGYRVERAVDAQEALFKACIVQPPPALITLDVMLPGKNGWELLAEIKANEDLQAVPVILISLAENEQATEKGAFAFLEKPISRDLLLQTITAAFAEKPAATHS